MKTPQECKEDIAKKYNHKSWREVIQKLFMDKYMDMGTFEKRENEAMQLYGEQFQKVNELKQPDVSGNFAHPKENKKESEVAVCDHPQTARTYLQGRMICMQCSRVIY